VPILRAPAKSDKRPGRRPDEEGEAGSCAQVVDVSSPNPITKGLFIPDSSLSPEERWQQVVSGGVEERHGDVIQGPPDTVAERLLQFLTQNNFVLRGPKAAASKHESTVLHPSSGGDEVLCDAKNSTPGVPSFSSKGLYHCSP